MELCERSGNLLFEAIEIVGPVQAERSVDNRQLHDELDSGRGARLEVGSRLNQQGSAGEIGEKRSDAGKTAAIELQLIFAKYADRAGVEESRGGYRANNRNSIFGVKNA